MELPLKLPAPHYHIHNNISASSNFPSLVFFFMSSPQNPNLRSQIPPKSLLFRTPQRKLRHGNGMDFLQERRPLRNTSFRVSASSGEGIQSSSRKRLIAFSSAITVILAVANRVLYKLALVPMQQYPFFLAQLTTFGYVIIYFSILYVRYHAGIVTDEMLAIPKSRFVAIGLLEALGLASGMSSGAMLPGPAIPILNQTFLVWQLTFATILLGRRHSLNQIAGCILVASGVVLAVASADQLLSGTEFVWPAIMIASSAFQAAASILKEFVFIDAATRLKGKLVDIFVVNSFGSGCQAFFVLLLLPFLSNVKGIPLAQLPSYLKSGAACFLNVGARIPGCDGAPLLPLLYVACNIAFNVSVLNLVKISSAVVASLAATASVPISIYILSRPLPCLPNGASLSSFFLMGSMVLAIGLVLYNLPQPTARSSKVL